MHDVTKRGLALAVAAGGLLITGAAPAVSAVSTHPGHPDHPGKESQPTGGSSHHAAIPVSAPQVKDYAGRHKATAASHPDGTPDHAAAQHATARHPVAAQPAARSAHRAAGPHHSAAQQASAHSDHGTTTRARTPAHAAGVRPATGTAAPAGSGGPAEGAQAEASNLGSGGLLAGNTIEVPVNAPVNVCGVVATVLGGGDHASDDHCVNGAGLAGGPSSSASADTAGNPGALSGNVVQVPVSLPANICGDTVTAVGGHNSAQDILCANDGPQTSSTATATAVNSPGLVNGNVVQVPVDAPLNLCGITANAVGVHDTAAGNTCANGGDNAPGMEPAPSRSTGAGAQAATANSAGAVTGNVVQVPIEAPINACGDSVDLVGVFDSALDNRCVNNTAGGSAAGARAVNNSGLATGNVAQLPIDLPTEVCGVVAGAVGYHGTAAGNSCVNTGAATTVSSADTSGASGIVSGNVAQGGVNAPVLICGTTVGAGIVNSGTEGNGCFNGPSPYPPPPAVCPPDAPPDAPPPPPVTPKSPLPQPPDAPPPPPVTPKSPLPQRPPLTPPPVTPDSPLPQPSGMELPHTGTDVLDFAGIGAGALLLGAGAMYAGRRRSRSAN